MPVWLFWAGAVGMSAFWVAGHVWLVVASPWAGIPAALVMLGWFAWASLKGVPVEPVVSKRTTRF